MQSLMDTFFVSHGSPMVAIDQRFPVHSFLKSWKSNVLQDTPKAILMASAHWQTDFPSINVINGPNSTIYDFYRFPPELYEFKYPAPGAPDLARKALELLREAGFRNVKEDNSRGLDHGAWIPLILMYPEANIPVFQLSVQNDMDALHHFNMGKALAPLREEGVLIIGSGNATHNDYVPSLEYAYQFDEWLKESLLNGRYDEVNNYLEKAPYAEMSHPFPDHFYPLHIALGASGENSKAELIHHSRCPAAISYASYRFHAADSRLMDIWRRILKKRTLQ